VTFVISNYVKNVTFWEPNLSIITVKCEEKIN